MSLVACGAGGLVYRAVSLQLVDHTFLAKEGDARVSRVATIAAHRGSLTDRYGEPLAVSTPVDSVVANPKELKTALDRLGELADALGQDEESLARKITSNLGREFIYLQRHPLPQTSE